MRVLLLLWTVNFVLSVNAQLYTCPHDRGQFYATNRDCLLYYRCVNRMLDIGVCFPWQRFDVHSLRCRGIRDVDCNPEYAGIWRQMYEERPEGGVAAIQDEVEEEEEVTEEEVSGLSLAQEMEALVEEATLTEEEVAEGEEEFLEEESSAAEKEGPLCEKEEEGARGGLTVDKNAQLVKEERFQGGNSVTREEKYKIESINNQEFKETSIIEDVNINKRSITNENVIFSKGIDEGETPDTGNPTGKASTNVLLMNVDNETLNRILTEISEENQVQSDQANNSNESPMLSEEIIALDLGRLPIKDLMQNNTNFNQNNIDGLEVNSGSDSKQSAPTTTARADFIFPSEETEQKDSTGGYWYWCGSGRFVLAQNSEEGDTICSQLPDPQFINEEGGSQQEDGDSAGHTFLGSFWNN